MDTSVNEGSKKDEVKELSLEEQLRHTLEEARIIVPGIQALFGFQLIAVFNDRFAKTLGPVEQQLHLAATALSVLAVALALAPASMHRQAEPGEVSRRLVDCSTGYLTAALVPLTLGITAEFYLLALLILHSMLMAIVAAGVLFVAISLLWFVFPQIQKRRRARNRSALTLSRRGA